MRGSAVTTLRLFAAVLLLGCGGENAGEQAAGEGESLEEAVAMSGGAEMEMAAEAYMIEISNPMPHEMVVSFMSPDGAVELGYVPPGGVAEFALTAPPTISVDLIATDPNRTHTVRGTIELSSAETATWTIGQN